MGSAKEGRDPGRRPRPGSRRPTESSTTRRERSRKRRRGVGRRTVLVILATAILLVVGVGTALAFIGGGGDETPGSVSVAGVAVGDMSRQELQRAVRARARELMKRPIVITRDDGEGVELTVRPRDLGATPDIAGAVDDALEERGPLGRVLERLGIAPTREVPIQFSFKEEAVAKLVRTLNAGFDSPPVAATVAVEDGRIVTTPGRAGVGIDENELRRLLTTVPERIELAVGEHPAPISDAAAEAARAKAEAIVASPVSVTFQGNGVAIQPAVLTKALRFTLRPPEIEVGLDEDVIYKDIAPAFEAREIPARDAHFDVEGTSVRLIPSATGRRLDMEAIADSIAALPETRSVPARFEVSQPEIRTEELSGLGIKELVGEFSTPYNCCEPRVQNIARAAETIDGTILPAGHRFSLNDALGPRTVENGYVEAPQIAAGKLEEGVGGGVSQVATTLFNAAFFAGMEIETHTPHSFYISRYPMGREATISMGGPDLVFRNDWPSAVLISAEAGDNSITVRLFSTLHGRRVETTTGEPQDYVEPEVVEQLDTSLPPGAREVEQSAGAAGFTITYTRKVWEGDRLKRDETYTWRYSPQNAFVRVGPEVSETPPETTTPTTPGTGGGGSDGGGGGSGGGGGGGGGSTPSTPSAPVETPSDGGGAAPPPPDIP